ncbi:MAG: right-handed parallel beta-helix repeat-containing protein [bacterium]
MGKKLMLGVVLSIGVFLKVEFGGASTIVCGTQSGTWNLVGSPYIVTGTVTIPQGLSLTIDPGVVIKFATNTSMINYGTLSAIGTVDGTITFTSNAGTPTPGDWNSIKFSGAQSKGTISYCLIEYGKQAIYLENASKITITHNTIRNNKGSIGAPGVNNQSGNVGEIGAGIYLTSSTNNTIKGNTIYNNQGGTGGQGGNAGGSGGNGGVGAGVYLNSSINNSIIDNTIAENRGGYGGGGGDFSSGGRGGIGTGIYLCSSTNNTISANIISNNRRGEKGQGGWGGPNGCYGNSYGIYIDSNSYNNIIDSLNTYNEEPILYYYGITTSTIIENQTLTLSGSSSTNLGRIVLINCSNFIIRNNFIAGGIGENGYTNDCFATGGKGGTGSGIYLGSSSNNIITRNTIKENQGGYGGTGGKYGSGGRGGIGTGIYLCSSTNNTISANIISNNRRGERGQGGGGGNSGIEGNPGNSYGIYIDSNSDNNIIDSVNTYNGEPIHYYYGITTPTTIEYQTLTLTGSGSTNLGRIVLINCSNFTIRNNFIAGGIGENGHTGGEMESGEVGKMGVGVYLNLSTNNTITGNIIFKNQGGFGGTGGKVASGGGGGIGSGIYLNLSTNNSITGNNIYENQGGSGGTGGDERPLENGNGGSGNGIYLFSSDNNKIINNTIKDNTGGTGKSNGNGVGIYCKSSVISELIYNNIYNNGTYNLQTDISPGTQTAEYNWWGSDPPATYTFSGNIDYDPWLRGAIAKIVIIPSSGTVGTLITVSGEDFGSTELIRIDFGTTQTRLF